MKKTLMLLVVVFATLFAHLAFAAVDLNSATEAELGSVKGIGSVKAKAIIDYRKKNGPFKSIDDLKGVKGFGAQTIEKIRAQLTVGTPSAPSPKGSSPAAAAPPAPKAPAPKAPAPGKR